MQSAISAIQLRGYSTEENPRLYIAINSLCRYFEGYSPHVIRVRTGKDPVARTLFSSSLYNLPDEFSIQEELSFGASGPTWRELADHLSKIGERGTSSEGTRDQLQNR